MTRVFLAAALLLGGALAGCGGEATASEADFCASYAEPMGTKEKPAQGMRAWVERLVETGTPESMPDEARDGLEALEGYAEDVDEDARASELLRSDLSEEQYDQVAALHDYARETCVDVLEEGAGDAG